MIFPHKQLYKHFYYSIDVLKSTFLIETHNKQFHNSKFKKKQ